MEKKTLIDMVGRMFGKLTVKSIGQIVRAPRQTRTYWNCECECGRTRMIRGDVLRSLRRTDCGCESSRPDFVNSTITVAGVTKTVRQWARAYGITCQHIYDRLRCGMDVEQAITTPVGKRGVRIRQKTFCTSAGQ